MGFGWDTKRKIDDAKRQTIQWFKTNPAFGGSIENPIHKDDIAQRFKYIYSSRENLDLNRVPDFLIAGPQRTGTTWLHGNLVNHPDVFLPERKELFYFNTLNLPDHRKHRSNDLAWYLSYFYPGPFALSKLEKHCKSAYGEDYEPRIRGEATASSAAMPMELLQEVVTLNPEMKVIIFVRDPIDRAWSHAKMAFLRKTGKRVDEIPEETFEAFFHQQYEVDCGHYTRIIDNWNSVLKPDHLYVRAHQMMSSNPEQLLMEVFEFLGIRAEERFIPQQSRKRINSTAPADLPPKLQQSLESLFGQEIERLKDMNLLY
ncbi:MAG: sulfotransferase domain-containing protein [Pseudomonadota bacterium]